MSENLQLLDVLRGYRNEILAKNRLNPESISCMKEFDPSFFPVKGVRVKLKFKYCMQLVCNITDSL